MNRPAPPIASLPGTAQADGFPHLALPVPIPLPPMEALRRDRLPDGEGWQFEPKWDGFRCLVYRSGAAVALQSKAGQPLARYFPELVSLFQSLTPDSFVLDGEIVILREGRLSFDDLLLRIHPAASRVAKLAVQSPATYVAFDLLHDPLGPLLDRPLVERRRRLEAFMRSLPPSPSLQLSPKSEDRRVAQQWFEDFGPFGLDGVMAKKRGEPYRAGQRDAMIKVKHVKSADCVVAGFRYAAGKAARRSRQAGTRPVGSLLLGLYDRAGLLHFVGFTSSFSGGQRVELAAVVEPLIGGPGFTGRAPGGPSRWSAREHHEWEPLEPRLVCEVQYDYFSQGRFRHGTKFLRWRPDKAPTQCGFDQVERQPIGTGDELFGK
ncbi:ATP-dependent DNA ligase [Candidatus Nitrospira bockiana]